MNSYETEDVAEITAKEAPLTSVRYLFCIPRSRSPSIFWAVFRPSYFHNY